MEIRPFRAFRFDKSVVGDAGSCIAPPYDVINQDKQQQLYKKNQYNIVRLIKGETQPSDTENDNKYTRAADYLKSWIDKGALKQDGAESIYAYVQDFASGEQHLQRCSFIAEAKLVPFGNIVRAHEQTLDEPIIDRLKLTRATAAKFGLPLCLYEDPEGLADKIIEKTITQAPLVDFPGEQKIRHRLFAVTDKIDIEKISEMMKDKSCIMADGHHRYTTALAFSKESSRASAKYQMLAFANTCRPGIVILATHRLAGGIDNFDFQRFINRLKDDFAITQHKFDRPQDSKNALGNMLSQTQKEFNNNKIVFGIYGRGGSFYAAVLKNERAMDLAAPEKSPNWRKLDVSVLQKLIFEKLMGISEDNLAKNGNLEYAKDTPNIVSEMVSKIDCGERQLAFFLKPVRPEQLSAITENGERMPQKTTYFYPKVYTGLVIEKL